MKKYVPVKLKWFVLFFTTRATHMLIPISDQGNEIWGKNAIEIKFKMQRDYFNPHPKSFPLLTVVSFKRNRWNDVGWKWERTYHEKWTESQISSITNARYLFEHGFICYPNPYILFLSIKTIKLIVSSNPAGAARF